MICVTNDFWLLILLLWWPLFFCRQPPYLLERYIFWPHPLVARRLLWQKVNWSVVDDQWNTWLSSHVQPGQSCRVFLLMLLSFSDLSISSHPVRRPTQRHSIQCVGLYCSSSIPFNLLPHKSPLNAQSSEYQPAHTDRLKTAKGQGAPIPGQTRHAASRPAASIARPTASLPLCTHNYGGGLM